MNVISTTVTGNTGTTNAVVTSGSKGKAYIYNSIIAGNTANDMANADSKALELSEKSIVSGAASMLGAYDAGVYPVLSGTAQTGGMTVDELKGINTNISVLPLIPEDVEVDQKGNKRTGTVMGAYVGK